PADPPPSATPHRQAALEPPAARLIAPRRSPTGSSPRDHQSGAARLHPSGSATAARSPPPAHSTPPSGPAAPPQIPHPPEAAATGIARHSKKSRSPPSRAASSKTINAAAVSLSAPV